LPEGTKDLFAPPRWPLKAVTQCPWFSFGAISAGGTAMFKFIEGLPPDVIALEAIGEVTGQDYRNTLIPRAEAMIAKGPIKMLYVIGADFTGFKLEALWDDGVFGLRHSRDFSHVAVVADHAWIRAMISMFRPLFHGDVRLFRLAELPAAKVWIAAAK
jgi:SpoIIAA-like